LLKAVREASNFEWDFRIVTPDGATKYLHSLGHLTAYGAENTEFVGTIMDVTERRVAEEALRGALGDLERASRLNTMGQLTASTAHEINRPLAAIITNAEACLLWLEADRLDLEEARQSAARIVRNGHRAGDIIKSVRALTRKSTLEMVRPRYQQRDPGSDRPSRRRVSPPWRTRRSLAVSRSWFCRW
jgi:signal transduction histidine kinase